MPETRFVDLAMSIGVADRIAALISDCDAALARLGDSLDHRPAWRVEEQRRLLLQPDLRTLVALATRLVEEDPRLGPVVAPALADLTRQHPAFAPYHARVLAPEGAFLAHPAKPASVSVAR